MATKPTHPMAVLLGNPHKIKKHGVVVAGKQKPKWPNISVGKSSKPKETPILENELLTVLKNFDTLVDDEKKQVKKLLFQDSKLKMLDIEIENRFHIAAQSNPIRMEVLKLFLDKKMNEAYVMEIIGYPLYECHFAEYAAVHFPIDYETKLADFLKPYPFWQGELYYLLGIARKPIIDVCVDKLVDIAEDVDTPLYDARDIIDELTNMKLIEIGKAALMFSSKTKDISQHKKFIKQYPDSERYFAIL